MSAGGRRCYRCGRDVPHARITNRAVFCLDCYHVDGTYITHITTPTRPAKATTPEGAPHHEHDRDPAPR